MKSAKGFTLLQEGKTWMNRWASIVLAGFGALGVNYVWTTYQGANGIFIAWPGWAAVAVAAWHWLNHYVMQETIYQATTNKATPTVLIPVGQQQPAAPAGGGA